MRRATALLAFALLLVGVADVDAATAGTLAFVTSSNLAPDSKVVVIDTATGAVVNSFSDTANYPGAIVFSRDGTHGWLSDQMGNKLFNSQTQTVTGPIGGPSTFGLAAGPDGTRLYAADFSNDKLAVLDANTGGIVTTIPTGDGPIALAVNSAGTRAYVANRFANSVTVADLTNNTAVTDIPGGGHLDRPESIGVTPDGTKVYVPSFGAGSGGTTVTVISAGTNTILGDITGFNSPTAATPSPNGKYMYIASRDNKRVEVIDVATDTLLAPIILPFFASDVAVTPAGDRLVVLDRPQGHVGVVDLAKGTLIAPEVSVPQAAHVAIEPVQTPLAAINATPAAAGQDAQFDGSGSSAPFGAITNFLWSFGDGTQGTGATTTHVYETPGTYDVSLTVTNDCAADALFGPPGVAFGGLTAFCNGLRTGTTIKQVEIPATPAPVPVTTPGGSIIEFRRRPSIKRLKRGRFRIDTGINVICGANAAGCGGSQTTSATLPRKAARPKRLVLAKTTFPARANSTAKLVFTVTGRKARRLASYKQLRFTTSVATHDRTGKAVTNVRKYSLRIPR